MDALLLFVYYQWTDALRFPRFLNPYKPSCRSQLYTLQIKSNILCRIFLRCHRICHVIFHFFGINGVNSFGHRYDVAVYIQLSKLTQLALEEGFVYPWTIRFLHVHTSFPLKIPCIDLQLLCVKCQIAALPCHGASVWTLNMNPFGRARQQAQAQDVGWWQAGGRHHPCNLLTLLALGFWGSEEIHIGINGKWTLLTEWSKITVQARCTGGFFIARQSAYFLDCIPG